MCHLVISRPKGLRFNAGDYMFVNIPTIAQYEWHPFTISSSSEQKNTFWLHIRCDIIQLLIIDNQIQLFYVVNPEFINFLAFLTPILLRAVGNWTNKLYSFVKERESEKLKVGGNT